jgi:ATP-binding cassette subfamily B (MDR/TAP) protein 1
VEYGLIGTEWECDTTEQKRELVERACKEAFADEFISRLPQVRPSVSYAQVALDMYN